MRSFLSVFLSMLAGFAGTAGLAQAAPPRSNPGQEAKTQQEAVISRYNNKKWTEAAELIEQFLLKFPSNENVPANCIRLAHCYQQTAQWDKYDAPLDECIKRFHGSRHWLYANAFKLSRQKDLKDAEKIPCQRGPGYVAG